VLLESDESKTEAGMGMGMSMGMGMENRMSDHDQGRQVPPLSSSSSSASFDVKDTPMEVEMSTLNQPDKQPPLPLTRTASNRSTTSATSSSSEHAHRTEQDRADYDRGQTDLYDSHEAAKFATLSNLGVFPGFSMYQSPVTQPKRLENCSKITISSSSNDLSSLPHKGTYNRPLAYSSSASSELQQQVSVPLTTEVLVQCFHQSRFFAEIRQYLEAPKNPYDISKLHPVVRKQYGEEYSHSFWYYTKVSIKRQATLTARNKGAVIPRIVQALYISLLLGTLFWDSAAGDFTKRVGLIVFSMTALAFSSMVEVPLAIQTKRNVFKHAQYKLFPTSAQILAQLLCHLPLAVLETVIFGTIVYWSVYERVIWLVGWLAGGGWLVSWLFSWCCCVICHWRLESFYFWFHCLLVRVCIGWRAFLSYHCCCCLDDIRLSILEVQDGEFSSRGGISSSSPSSCMSTYLYSLLPLLIG